MALITADARPRLHKGTDANNDTLKRVHHTADRSVSRLQAASFRNSSA
jgi:hypothetical protein